jgi:WD40 repeat protein
MIAYRTVSAQDETELVLLRRLEPGTSEVVVARFERQSVFTLAFSPDGRWLANGNRAQIDVYNLTRSPYTSDYELKGHRANIMSIGFSEDGKTMASASIDSTVRLWDTATWKCVRTLVGHRHQVFALAFGRGANSNLLATGSRDGTIRLWRFERETERPGFLPWSPHILPRGSGWDPSGETCFLMHRNDTFSLWDPRTWREKTPSCPLPFAVSNIVCAAAGPEAQTLALALRDRTVHLWRPGTTNTFCQFSAGRVVNTLGFSSSGNMLAGTSEGMMWMWDAKERREVARARNDWHFDFYTPQFTPDEKQLVIGYKEVGRKEGWFSITSIRILVPQHQLVGRIG